MVALFLPDGLVPFGTLPCEASLLSHLGDRGPGEGERSRSRFPFPLPFLLMSCLTLHESFLKHCPSTNHSLLITFSSDRGSARGPVISGIEVSIICLLFQVLLDHVL